MFSKLFLLFAILPIIEIAVLVNVGEQIGGWNTVGIVILTAFVGAYLVRQQGLATLQEAQLKMQRGELPGKQMAEGLLLIIAGVLLVTPGFITDGIGFLFSVPVTRKWFAVGLMKHLSARVVTSAQGPGFYQHSSHTQRPHTQQPHASADADVIEGEFQHKRDEPSSRDRLN